MKLFLVQLSAEQSIKEHDSYLSINPQTDPGVYTSAQAVAGPPGEANVADKAKLIMCY